MDVRMPDGTLVKNVPDNITQADLLVRYDAFKTPDTRGNIISGDVPTVAGQVPNPPVIEPKRSMQEKMMALYEVPATMLSGAALTIPSAISAMATGEPPMAMANRNMFQPRSGASQDVLQSIGGAFEASKLPPVMPTGMLPSYARMMGATQPQMQTARQAVPQMADMLRREQPTMAGVGAAATPEAVTRTQMANQLRVPVPLSKGQAERELGQQQFEIETPKISPELGKPLVEAQAKRNDAILQNFDAYVDATGKETFGLRATGKVVTDVLNKEAQSAKTKIEKAYTLAKEKGETEAPIDYAPLRTFIEEQTPTTRSKIAPVLDVVNEQLSKNDPKNSGQITINALEDIYKVINQSYEPNTPAAIYGKQMRDIINQVTEGKGGDLYQQARTLRQEYSKRFENISAIDNLLRTKANSSDRYIALEDVFQKSIINGSLDDVKNLGYALKKSGNQGLQALNELRGQAIEYLKDRVTQSIDTDIYGNPVVSPAKFKSAVRELDQDGKLDYLFGKKGAEEIRDLMETTILVNAPLKGAANTSNSASLVIRSLDMINRSPVGKIPVVGSLTKYSFEKAQEKALKKKIQESINYSPSKMADELKKGK
tara:strand:+ start:1194 stop:2993 length:1800 start_codon:yes stop_codon:yes gene_type:complete